MQRIEHDRVLQMRHRWCVVYATPSLCQEELEELVFLLFLRRPKSEHPDFLCDVSCTATCYAVRRMERATLHESMVYATCRATLPRAAHPSASTNLVGHSRIAAARAFDAATRITIPYNTGTIRLPLEKTCMRQRCLRRVAVACADSPALTRSRTRCQQKIGRRGLSGMKGLLR